jgi:hypothetical protein
MTTIINGSSPSITFSDSTTQTTAGLPLTGGTVTGATNLATSSGNVGIGTASPATKLSVVNGNILAGTANAVANGGGWDNYIAVNNSSASGAIAFNLKNGTYETNIGMNNAYCYGIYAASSSAYRFAIAHDGTVGIGLTSGFGAQLDVSGLNSSNSVYFHSTAGTGVYLVNGNTSFNTISDERNKIIDRPITDALANLNTLRTVYGRYKVEGEQDKSRLFLIAQDVQKVYPEVIDVQDNEEKTLGLRYVDLVPVLIAAIQELKATVDAQATRLAVLEATGNTP